MPQLIDAKSVNAKNKVLEHIIKSENEFPVIMEQKL